MKWVLDAHAMQGSVKQALMVRIWSLPMPKGFTEVLKKLTEALENRRSWLRWFFGLRLSRIPAAWQQRIAKILHEIDQIDHSSLFEASSLKPSLSHTCCEGGLSCRTRRMGIVEQLRAWSCQTFHYLRYLLLHALQVLHSAWISMNSVSEYVIHWLLMHLNGFFGSLGRTQLMDMLADLRTTL